LDWKHRTLNIERQTSNNELKSLRRFFLDWMFNVLRSMFGVSFTKRKVPARPCGQTGTNRGMGVRQALFPVSALGAPSRGCRFPDAILHGKRSLRPHSRAVQRLTVAEFRVRLFSSLGLVVAPPAREPGQDTFAISFPRLDHLAPGLPPLLTVRWPGATGLAS